MSYVTRCIAVHSLTLRATAVATALSEALTPTLAPAAVRGHLLKLSRVHLAMLEASSKLSAEQLAMNETGMAHSNFILAFTKLVATLTPLFLTLEQTASLSTSSAQSDLFWKLWDLLLSSCHAFNSWPNVWSEKIKASNTPLFTAVHGLTAWLLPFTRDPSGGWAALLTSNTAAHRAEQALCILTVPVNCFINITSQPSRDRSEALDYIYDLPHNFVAAVCCLMCEQLSDTLPHVLDAAARHATAALTAGAMDAAAVVVDSAASAPTSTTDTAAAAAASAAAAAATHQSAHSPRSPNGTLSFFNSVAASVGCFIAFDMSEGSEKLLSIHSVPLIIQLFKAVMAHYPPSFDTDVHLTEAGSTTHLLAMMLRRERALPDPGVQSALSCALQHRQGTPPRRGCGYSPCTATHQGRAGAGSSEACAQPRPRSHLVTRSITTDIQVIRSVCSRLQLAPLFAQTGYRLLDSVHATWDQDGSCVLPASRLTHQVGCLQQLAYACISFAQSYMRQQQQQQRRLRPSQQAVPRMCTYSMDSRLVQRERSLVEETEEGFLGMDNLERVGMLMLKVAVHGALCLALRSSETSSSSSSSSSNGTSAITPSLDVQQQQQQRQQQQSIDTHPDLLRLKQWTHMPGPVAALEALLRAMPTTTRPDNSFQLAALAIKFIVSASESLHPDMLHACLSLASTVHKLLYATTHTFPCGSGREERSTRREAADRKGGGTGEVSFGHACSVIRALMTALAALDLRTQLYASGSPGLRNYRDCSKDPVTGSKHSRSDHSLASGNSVGRAVTSVSNEGRQITNQGVVMYPFASRRALLVYQLQTALLACLVPLCHFRIMVAEDDPRAWLAPVVRVVGNSKSRLAEVGTTLLSERVFSSKARELLVATCMERFCTRIFSGRLMSGCCNPSCESLEGTSEAALKTWPCKGCRRARYCSTECQRLAWVEGGHRDVCQNVQHVTAGSLFD
ncbi:MAG: hypothetical protein WDW36_004927 [Sanguina aurantia]